MKDNKVVKAGLGYTIGNYLLKGLAFLTIPLFVRLLSTAEYGKYNTFLAYESILFVILGLAIHSSFKNARYKYGLVSEGSEKGKDYYSFVSSCNLFILGSGVLWLVLINLLCPLISDWIGFDRVSLNMLVLYAIGSAIITCFNVDISIDYEYKKFLVVSAFNALLNIALSILLIVTVFDSDRCLGRIVGTVVPVVLVTVYIVYYFFKRAHPAGMVSFLRWGIKYSLPIVPHGLSQIILNQFDRIMITKMVDDSATGIYSFAYNIFAIIQVTFVSLDNVWSPWFYEKMKAKKHEEIRKYSSMYMLVMLIFSSIMILVSPELIKLLGSRDYWDAMYCVIPVVAGGYFAFLYTIPCCVEYYYEKTKFIALGTTSAALINIVTNYIFIDRFGYVAAAYTTLATYMLYFLFHLFIAKRITREKLFSDAVFAICTIGILAVSALGILFIKVVAVRWVLAVIMFVLTVWIEEKKFGLINGWLDSRAKTK